MQPRTSISILGCSFHGERSSLVLAEVVSLEVLPSSRGVDPQAALTADGACAFNGKADDVCRVRGRQEVDVLARNVGSAGVGQWQEVDLARRLFAWRSHTDSRIKVIRLFEDIQSGLHREQRM